MIKIYDRDGRRITLERFAELVVDPSYSRVARTTVMDGRNTKLVFEVFTVWIGVDYGFSVGVPLIFETLVIATGSGLDIDNSRYTTVADAQQGHAETVTSVAATLTDAIIMDIEEEL